MMIGQSSITNVVSEPRKGNQMSLIAKAASSGGSFTPVPPGLHLARCYRIIDLGTQKKVWKGQEKLQRQIMVQFEVHSIDDDGNPLLTPNGEPLSISKNYTLSLNENARLSQDLESWRGNAFTADERKGFDLKKLLGVWAMISVTKETGNDGNEYTNIANINPVPASIKKAGLPEGVNDLKLFNINNPDMKLFESLGAKVREKIERSPEWQSKQGKEKFDDSLDDIDF